MVNEAGYSAWAADALKIFQRHSGSGDDHAVADLICDLGHLADERGLDFLDEVRRGITNWYAELHASEHNILGRDVVVQIIIEPRQLGSP